MKLTRQTKINILSSARYHQYYLARELALSGYDVKFYTCMPKKSVIRYGMPNKKFKTIFWLISPFFFLERKVFKGVPFFFKLRVWLQDLMTLLLMRKCDIIISNSSGYTLCIRKAKKKGTKVIVHRGSKHILEQKRILETIPSLHGESGISNFIIKRELEDYATADYVAVQTEHVKRSFLKHNYPEKQLGVIPTGVDLSEFYPIPNTEKEYDVIMVGGWRYRKGCDLIVETIRQTDLKFLHVGGIVDMEFPQESNFTHVDVVKQKELVNYYNKAKIFLFPSREEGLAMVQAQAIACNLPLVGSKDSGAEDLKKLIGNSKYITILEDYNVETIKKAVYKALDDYKKMGNTIYAKGYLQNLTWTAYKERYISFLTSL